MSTLSLKRGTNTTVALLSTAHFVTDSYSSFLGPLLPLLTVRLRLTAAQAGLLIPTMMITTSLMQPLYGMISDRYLKRSMAVFGPLIAAIFFSLIGLADSLPLLVTCIVIGGMGIGAFHPQSAAIVSAASEERRGTTMSVFSSAGTVGVAVGPVLITSIVASFGLGKSYIAMVFGIVTTALLWRFCPPLERVRESHTQPLHQSLKAVLGPLSLLYFAVVLRSAVHVSIQTYLPFLLTNNGLHLTQIGWVLAAFIFFGGIGGLFGGTLADRFGSRRVSLISLVLAAPFLIAAMLTASWPGYVLLAIGGTFLNVCVPVNVVMAQRLVPGGASTVSALMMGFAWGAGALLTPLTGLLSAQIGFASALMIVSVLPAFAALLLLRFPSDAATGMKETRRSTESLIATGN